MGETDELLQAERRAQKQAAGIVVFVCVFVFLLGVMTGEPHLSGTFGDSFGVLTSLFTGTALAGLWYTIRLQKIELKATRKELEGQREHMGQQAFALSKQNFENTFYRVVALIEDRTSHLMDPGTNDPARRGREGFQRHAENLNHFDRAVYRDNDAPREAVAEKYRQWYASYAQALAAYFQLVYEALNTIDKSNMPSKQRYADVLRALMSPAEMHLLFYHGISGLTSPDFERLLARYRFFERFDFTQVVVIPDNRRAWYAIADGDTQ